MQVPEYLKRNLYIASYCLVKKIRMHEVFASCMVKFFRYRFLQRVADFPWFWESWEKMYWPLSLNMRAEFTISATSYVYSEIFIPYPQKSF